MHWHFFVIGRPKLPFVRAGVEEYARRLHPLARVQLECLKIPAFAGAAGMAQRVQQAESALLLQKSEGMFRVALDERGALWDSREFSAKIAAWELAGVKKVAVLIGGADGHTPGLRQAVDVLFSLSRLTFQHELALVVFYEQIYRAYAMKSGLPYHRG